MAAMQFRNTGLNREVIENPRLTKLLTMVSGALAN
jgi:hypothetical protein